jgi:serine protease Do
LTPELRKHLGAPDDRGVLVARVEPGTPAAAAGIAVGDVLVEIGGRRVATPADVVTELAGVGRGKAVTVDLVRDGKRSSVRATLTDDAPASALAPTGSGIRWLDELLRPFRDRGANQTALVK